MSLGKDGNPSFLQSVFEEAMQWLHSKNRFSAEMMDEQPVKDMVSETYRVLSEGLNNSIKQDVPAELTQHLRESTFIFSGFKTYHQIKEASSLLIDEKGGFKSFEKFRQDVTSIDEKYNRRYLEAEYNFAVQSTQMAVKWNDFERDGDDYYIQYRTAGDSKVRMEHAALHNTTLPINDPFWDEYLPPLDWGCRCTAVQVRKNKYSQSDSKQAIEMGEKATAKPKQKIFRFNPGKTGKVFPPKHPYLPKGCGTCNGVTLAYNPNSEQCSVCMSLERQKRIAMRKEEHHKLQQDPNYKDVVFNESTGGLKATHKDHNFAPEGGEYEKMAQEAGFKAGHCVIFTSEKSCEIGKKFAEGKWDGQVFEVAGKKTATSNNILKGLKHCATKPDVKVAVLVFPKCNFDEAVFNNAVARYIGCKKTGGLKWVRFNEIICVQSGEIIHKLKDL